MAVTSVFGRIGAVIAVLGDYAASLVDNDSGVAGATVADALDELEQHPYPAWMWGCTTLGNSVLARFIPLTPTIAAGGGEAGTGWPAPCDGFIKFAVGNLTTALATANLTVTVRIAGANTAITFTINAGGTTGSDQTNSVAISAGQLVTIQTQTSVADNSSSNLRVSIGFSKAA